MTRLMRWPLIAAMVLCAACGRQEGHASTDSEKLSWDQPIAPGVDVSRYRFAVYVDASRVELPDASCKPPVAAVAACTAPLPKMDPGQHVLKLVSYTLPEHVDSASGPPLQITVAR